MVYLKQENTQVTGSFKVRGALNAVLSLSADKRHAGVVAASTGNHGAGVAYAAQVNRCQATIFVPKVIEAAKLRGIQQRNAKIVRYGDDCVESETQARAMAIQNCQQFISPYNDPDVIAGQGTIGLELTRQMEAVDDVFVAVGGGGLIGGIGTYVKSRWPNSILHGCSPSNSCVMQQSLKAGQIIEAASTPTLSDSTAGGIEAQSVTFPLCQAHIDRFHLVTEVEIEEALRGTLDHHKTMIEGAAAVAVASLKKMGPTLKGRRVVVILCGSNISMDTLSRVLNGGDKPKGE